MLNNRCHYTLLFLAFVVLFFGTIVAYGENPPFVIWSDERKLTWDDFDGTPHKYPEKYKNHGYNDQAFTWGWQDFHDLYYRNVSSVKNQYQITKIDTVGVFDKTQSWVTESDKKDAGILNHEQGHFDIIEIYARKIEWNLLFAVFDCPNDKCDESSVKADIRKRAEEMGAKTQSVHDQYDDDIKHGIKTQSYWDSKIKTDLTRCMVSDSDYSDVNKPIPKITTGFDHKEIECTVGWNVMQKDSNKKLTCVTPTTSSILENRGWGKIINLPKYPLCVIE